MTPLQEGDAVGSFRTKLTPGDYMVDVIPDSDEHVRNRAHFTVYSNMLRVIDVISAPHYTDGRKNMMHFAFYREGWQDCDLQVSIKHPDPTYAFRTDHETTDVYYEDQKIARYESSADGKIGEHFYADPNTGIHDFVLAAAIKTITIPFTKEIKQV